MAWQELLNTPAGLSSLGVIVFVVVIGIAMGRYYTRKMDEDAAGQQ
ncbi:MAG: hypothetical protein H6R10_1318 [Rhodocyclaceae bacterium]|nr:hypothetical protein [Rhodocyclaceae bacterium]